MVARQTSSGTRCFTPPLGRGFVPLPSSPTIAESSQDGQGAGHQCNTGLPKVAVCSVVANGTGDDGRASPPPSLLQENSNHSGRKPPTALSGTIGGGSYFSKNYAIRHKDSALDKPDLDFLSCHLSVGSKSGYGYAFQKFVRFCATLNVDPYNCMPAVLVKYVRHLYESGASYSAVNFHRSAVAKFHFGLDGQSIGSHPLVSQAVKAVFRLRPPLPRYVATYDITKIFSYLQSLPDNQTLSLKQLTLKTTFLLTTAIISRVSSLCSLGPDVLVYKVIVFFLPTNSNHIYDFRIIVLEIS